MTGASPSLTSLVAWAEFALCLAVPFFFAGVVVSLALTRSPYPIGQVYGADLIGAAIGCIGVLALLNVMSGPSAVLWVGGLVALAALGFASSGSASCPNPRPLVPSYFATAEASSQGACSWRLPTRSRPMAFDRPSSRITWKRRPILPTIAGIHFPASPSVRAKRSRRRCSAPRRMRRGGDQGFQTWIQFQITRLTDPCHPGLGSDQGFLAFFCSGFLSVDRWDWRILHDNGCESPRGPPNTGRASA